MAAGHAQRVFDADPSRRVALCDHLGMPRWHDLWTGNPVIATPDDVRRGEPVHRVKNAKLCRPYVAYPFTTQTGWKWTGWRAQDHVGHVYLTEADREVGRRIRESGPFVFLEPMSKIVNRTWPLDRYLRVIEAMPSVRFVRAPDGSAPSIPGVESIPNLSFRQVLGVIAEAEAYLGSEGGCQHAAAVLKIPAVALFGGCISVRYLGYPWHVNIADEGPGTPCGRWLRCQHCEAAMARITVDRVSGALRTLLAGHVREVA